MNCRRLTGMRLRTIGRDSLRFRVHLAKRLRLRTRDVQALVVGEHGISGVPLWSSATVAGLNVVSLLADAGHDIARVRAEVDDEIRYANINIIEGADASQYGFGAVSVRLAEAVQHLNDGTRHARPAIHGSSTTEPPHGVPRRG
jgi:malate/lactate dehydrogenase